MSTTETLAKYPEIQANIAKTEAAIAAEDGQAISLLYNTQLRTKRICIPADQATISLETEKLIDPALKADIWHYVKASKNPEQSDSIKDVYARYALKIINENDALLDEKFIGDMRAKILMPQAA